MSRRRNAISHETPDYLVSRIATTHRVRDTVITKEALDDLAERITSDKRKVAVLVEHDSTCPPCGMAVSAKVVPLEDGHYALDTTSVLYGPPTLVLLPDGTNGFLQRLPTFPFPLSVGDFGTSVSPEIKIDPTSLGGIAEAREFSRALEAIAPEVGYSVSDFERRSAIPDPQMIIDFGAALSGLWLTAKLGNAAAKALEPRVKQFLDVAFEAMYRMAVHANPKTRPITYIFYAHGTPRVSFVVRTRDPHIAIRAMSSDFSDVSKQVASLHGRFNAELIQLMLDDDGEWKFSYLVTSDGTVVGSKDSFDRRAVHIGRLQQQDAT